MRIRGTGASVRVPWDTILGTRSHVRVLRVLREAREPMSVRELARRAGEHLRAVQLAVGRLVDAGVVEPVGTGTYQPVRLNPAHPLAGALEALFLAERARFERVVSGLKALVQKHGSRATAVWVSEPPDAGGLTVGVLALSDEVDALAEALREAIADLARREDVPIDVRGWTRPDLDALGPAPIPALERSVVLHGVLAVGRAGTPGRAAVRRRSHTTVDDALRERARRVAAALGRRPELVRAAREEVAARLALAGPNEARTLREWRQVLNAMSVPRLRRWLVDQGERATRLRQSMPVALLRAADEPAGPARPRP